MAHEIVILLKQLINHNIVFLFWYPDQNSLLSPTLHSTHGMFKAVYININRKTKC